MLCGGQAGIGVPLVHVPAHGHGNARLGQPIARHRILRRGMLGCALLTRGPLSFLPSPFPLQATNVGNLITDTLVVAHGFGSLIVANALRTNECSLSFGASWIELQDGLPYGRLLPFAHQFCEELASGDLPGGDVPPAATQLQDDLYMCTPGTTLPSPAWSSLAFSNPSFDASLESTVVHNVYASMCADEPNGVIGSAYLGVLKSVPVFATAASDAAVRTAV